jgi:putative ABC transport system ATP-binding protein
MGTTGTTGTTGAAPPPETAAAPSDVVIRLRDVVKEYPGDPPTRVLHGVDLTVRQGELLAIVGPSGSGKSTLLHIMGTLDRPTAGDVHIAGHDMARLSDKQLSALRASENGFVYQQFFLLPGLSAVENVADGLLYTGRRLRDRRRRARATLERVGLGHRLDYNTEKLSGGERQRVAIAWALVGEPSVVLADEPTGNLDSRSGEAIVELLHELNAEGSTIVVITHDHDIAGSLPRQVAVRDGRIESDSAHPDGRGGGGRGGAEALDPSGSVRRDGRGLVDEVAR